MRNGVEIGTGGERGGEQAMDRQMLIVRATIIICNYEDSLHTKTKQVARPSHVLANRLSPRAICAMLRKRDSAKNATKCDDSVKALTSQANAAQQAKNHTSYRHHANSPTN